VGETKRWRFIARNERIYLKVLIFQEKRSSMCQSVLPVQGNKRDSGDADLLMFCFSSPCHAQGHNKTYTLYFDIKSVFPI
jgi:hypothetical protein